MFNFMIFLELPLEILEDSKPRAIPESNPSMTSDMFWKLYTCWGVLRNQERHLPHKKECPAIGWKCQTGFRTETLYQMQLCCTNLLVQHQKRCRRSKEPIWRWNKAIRTASFHRQESDVHIETTGYSVQVPRRLVLIIDRLEAQLASAYNSCGPRANC